MDDYFLAIETSSAQGSVALLRDAECRAEIDLEEGLKHGRSLLPAAEKLLADAKLKVSDLSAIAVSVGPGSYTGIRVGVMAAKALAFAGRVPLAPVSSLAALAWEARDLAERIIPAQDARRDEVYCAVYRPVGGGEIASEMAGMITALQENDREKLAADAMRRTFELQRQMLQEMDEPTREKFAEDEKKLTHALAQQFDMQVVDLTDITIANEVLQVVPKEVAVQYHAVPIDFDAEENILVIAISDPQDIFPLDHLASEVECQVNCVLATYSDIQNVLVRYYDYSQPQLITPHGREAGHGYPSVQVVQADTALSPEEVAVLGTGSGSVIVGTAVRRYAEVFAARAAKGSKLLPEPIAPSAAAVGYLGFLKWRLGETATAEELQPVYLRRDNPEAKNKGPLDAK